ncbi:hypothetical protein BDZ45DRAFT_750709 [Acephala macrosclerotiorum]|nr:hypothetical protein BDZ45DRAFT_750709 [Acephala macrosclerotiorum]
MASILTGVDAVEKVIQIWNQINERIKNQENAEALAAVLSDFGLERSRVALQTDVKNAQLILRDLSAAPELKKDVNSQLDSVYELLKSIPPAIEEVVKNAKRGRIYKLARTNANKDLTQKVEAYHNAFREFDQAVARGVRASTSDSCLLLAPGEMKLVGKTPKLVVISDGITAARVSYAPPGEDERIVDVLWETLQCTDQSWRDDDNNMRALATKLSEAVPHWHIPLLLGYETNPESKTMRLVFQHPDPVRGLASLSDIYARVETAPSLTLRVRLCEQLAVAVLHAHKLNVVHKHIRPSNLLIAVPPNWEEMDRIADVGLYLSGWQNARITSRTTAHVGESAAQKVMYQHPERHETEDGNPVEKYNIGHDIYSLGVCMLELLTWDVLVWAVRDDDSKQPTGEVMLSDAYEKAFQKKGFHDGIEIRDGEDVDLAELCTRDPVEVKETLVEVAKTCVPPKAGDRLANLVCRCLTCLDPTPMYGGSRFHDGNDRNQTSKKFAQEILSDFNLLLKGLEAAPVDTFVEAPATGPVPV